MANYAFISRALNDASVKGIKTLAQSGGGGVSVDAMLALPAFGLLFYAFLPGLKSAAIRSAGQLGPRQQQLCAGMLSTFQWQHLASLGVALLPDAQQHHAANVRRLSMLFGAIGMDTVVNWWRQTTL